SSKVQHILATPDRVLYLSSVSAWEITVKYSLGKLSLQKPPESLIRSQRRAYRIKTLPLRESMVLHESQLPKLHKDPFDRMLVCQAIVKNYVILTPDPLIQQYPVLTEW